MTDTNDTGGEASRLAPAAAILKAAKDARKKAGAAQIGVVGVGSAALVAALLYANRKRSRDQG